MVAERIVDVLEVIEVDEEHGGGGPAAAHFADQSFQPFAEIDAVGQPADRIVQGEMAQLRFAGGDRLRGAAGVAQDQAAEQSETANRHRNERQNASGHLAARLARVPGDAGDWIALRVGDGGHIVVGRWARILGRAQAGQLQVVADPSQQRAVDELDRQHNRRAGIAGGKLASRSRWPPPSRWPVCPSPARSSRRNGSACLHLARRSPAGRLPVPHRCGRARNHGSPPAREAAACLPYRRRHGSAHIRRGRSRRRSRPSRGRRSSPANGRGAHPPIADRISRAPLAWPGRLSPRFRPGATCVRRARRLPAEKVAARA